MAELPDLNDLMATDALLDALGAGEQVDGHDPVAGPLAALAGFAQADPLPQADPQPVRVTPTPQASEPAPAPHAHRTFGTRAERRFALRSLAAGVAVVGVVSTGGISAAVTGDPFRPVDIVLDQMVPGRADKAPPPERPDGEVTEGFGPVAESQTRSPSGADADTVSEPLIFADAVRALGRHTPADDTGTGPAAPGSSTGASAGSQPAPPAGGSDAGTDAEAPGSETSQEAPSGSTDTGSSAPGATQPAPPAENSTGDDGSSTTTEPAPEPTPEPSPEPTPEPAPSPEPTPEPLPEVREPARGDQPDVPGSDGQPTDGWVDLPPCSPAEPGTEPGTDADTGPGSDAGLPEASSDAPYTARTGRTLSAGTSASDLPSQPTPDTPQLPC